MDETFLIASFLLGVSLGAVYFGGLWLTIVLLPQVRSKSAMIVSSYVVRITLTLAGFCYILIIDWQQFISCFVGFILVRQALLYRQRAGSDTEDRDGDDE